MCSNFDNVQFPDDIGDFATCSICYMFIGFDALQVNNNP